MSVEMLPSLKFDSTVSAADTVGLPSHARYLWGDVPAARAENRGGVEPSMSFSRGPERIPATDSLLAGPGSGPPVTGPARGPVDLPQPQSQTQPPFKNDFDRSNPNHPHPDMRKDSSAAEDDRRRPSSEFGPSDSKEKRKMKRFR